MRSPRWCVIPIAGPTKRGWRVVFRRRERFHQGWLVAGQYRFAATLAPRSFFQVVSHVAASVARSTVPYADDLATVLRAQPRRWRLRELVLPSRRQVVLPITPGIGHRGYN